MYQTPNTFYRISIKALVVNNDGKILFIKENNGLRELPWWWLDHWEDAQSWIIREIREELGIAVKKISNTPEYFFTREEWWYRRSNLVFKVELEHMNFIPSDECVELAFLTVEDAKKLPLYPNITKFLDIYQKTNF